MMFQPFSFFASRSRFRSLLLCVVLICALLGKANAYSLNGKKWPAGSTIVMQMGLGNAPRTLLDGNTSWNAAAVPALGMWNQRMARVRFSSVMNSTAPVASGDRVNSVAFSNSVFGQSFGSGTIAVAYYMMQGSSLIEVDVLFNRTAVFDSYRGDLRFSGPGGMALGDVRRVFLHEVGHGLGLNHSDGDNVMAPIISDRDQLSRDDIAGVQAMYGAPAPTPTPTPVPTPGPTPKPTPAPAPAPARGSFARLDFNLDVKADLVWQNKVTGQRVIWLMNGTTLVGSRALPTAATQWQIAASADFNADGHPDLVWQNTANGQRAVWLMKGTTFVGVRLLPTVPVQWQIASTGDFNRDGKPDLVWQNTATGERGVWLMNGTAFAGERRLPIAATVWQIAGTGDFGTDGHVDLVWQNTRTGQRAIWLMNGTTRIGVRNLPSASPQWQIVGTGDFGADGHVDLVWQNNATGQRAIWLMNGASYARSRNLPTVSTQWEIRSR